MTPQASTETAPAPSVAPPPADRAGIVFVGGTGRSGTHVIAKLLGRDRHYTLIPMECRFHVDADGFPGLLSGTVTKEDFLRRMRRHWWRRLQLTRFRGLHRLISRQRFERALEAFDRRFDAEPEAACAQLFLDLLWPERPAEEASWRGIIEQSCDTIAQAETLVRLFPESRFVHVVRDGRDASASRVRQARWLPYGAYPRTRRQGLEWWEGRIRRIDRGARAIPEGRLLEVELGALFFRAPDGRVRRRGRRRVRRLARFAGVGIEAPMRRFARARMSFEAANEARWRRGLGERRQRDIDALYVETLERLERDGVSCAPLLRRAYRRSQAHAQG
jgi:hypothetical protein